VSAARKPKSLSDSHADEDAAEARGDRVASGIYKIRRLAGATKKVLDIVRSDAEKIAERQDEIEEDARSIAASVKLPHARRARR